MRTARTHVARTLAARTYAARTLAGAAVVAMGAAMLVACAPEDADDDAADEGDGALATLMDGVLTIGTSDPAYEPWMVDNDPTNGEGYESAVAYAVAAELGFAAEDVEWVRVSFDQIIAPGEKSFDVAINQVSISDERRENLDFSSSY